MNRNGKLKERVNGRVREKERETLKLFGRVKKKQ